MKMTFDVTEKMTRERREQILAHHDVVFRAPVHDPLCGLPIGNGDLGCLLYTEADRLHVCVNKTDLWDDTRKEADIFCVMEGENLTSCRHGAHLTLDFGCPAFEMLFQNFYEGRISLHDGCARITADTPFAKTALTAFVSEEAEVSVIRADVNFQEDMPLSVQLQRWGSRTEWFWYANYTPGTHWGLDGTSAAVSDGIMYLTQVLNGTIFCAAVLPVCETAPDCRRSGSHTVRAQFDDAENHSFTLYITIATGDTTEEAEKAADKLVRKAAEKGYEALYAGHSAKWADFWSKSFVSIPFDYMENLWYLNLYYANSQMKGKYPAHFCNGLWSFYHDFVPWNHFFHYNMQLASFPLEAANHPELLETYYDFRVKQLPMAEAFAEKSKKTRGAFYGDVCDRHGRNDNGVAENCTCGAQIAMMLYRHYLYSGDSVYLREKALPVMEACALFYLDVLEKCEDGYYHIFGTTGYEGSPLLDDSITDYVMIRILFGALCEVLPDDKAAPYRERLDSLPPYRMTGMLDDEVENGIFTRGIGKGKEIRGERVLCVGRHHGTDNWIRKTHGNCAHDYYGFPDTEMAPVYPAGIVGIRDRGTELYDAIYNSICLHHPALFEGNALGRDAGDGVCMGWCMEPIYLARMGMSDLLVTHMENTITTWMLLPQGFGYYTPSDHEHLRQRWDTYSVHNTQTGEKSVVPAWNFRHFDYETLPILAAAVNEMLMQSHDGILRLFCAVKKTESYAFELRAQGGFTVRAVYENGLFDACVTSERGEELFLAVENADGEFVLTTADGDELPYICENGIYRLGTTPGMKVRIRNTGSLSPEKEYERNTTAKTFGDAVLGSYEALK